LNSRASNISDIDLSAWIRANQITGDVTVNASVAPVTDETATENNQDDAITTVEYRQLGDINGDGSIDTTDARDTASEVAKGTVNDPAADTNGDGEVTAVDAMLIAQRASGVRDENYELIRGD
jgi:hypothetical protein